MGDADLLTNLRTDNLHQTLGLRWPIVIYLCVLSVNYAAISGSTVSALTVQWDEFTDLLIASDLSHHPLTGSTYDKSQARLPMYATASVYRLMQFFQPNLELLDVLQVSRWISISITVVAIWGTFYLGFRLYNLPIALLAATLFTFSPYILQYGRAAMTEGDAFTSATVVFVLIAFEQFEARRTTGWLAGLSFFLALAIAAKFFLVILIPALITYHLIVGGRNILGSRLAHQDSVRVDNKARTPFSYVFLGIGTGSLALIALLISLLQSKQPAGTAGIMYQMTMGFWLVTLLSIGFSLAVAFIYFRRRESSPDSCVRWPVIWGWLTILPLSFSMVLALFPEHIFNPHIFRTLVGRGVTLDGNNELVATVLNSGRLYVGILLFKMGLPFGLATCASLVWAVRKSIDNSAFLLLSLILSYYVVMLAILPLQQPFWLMGVYPLILLLLSALIVHNFTYATSVNFRLGWSAYIAGCTVWLVVGLVNVYPTFGYYGYELLGDRWLGNDSRGYRGVVVVTNDGSTEAIDWLRKNATPGAVVLSYLNDIHIINHLADQQEFPFELQHAVKYQGEEEISRQLSRADFVVSRLINDFGAPSPAGNSTFLARFGAVPVYQVFRGRGAYKMPVFKIYERTSS